MRLPKENERGNAEISKKCSIGEEDVKNILLISEHGNIIPAKRDPWTDSTFGNSPRVPKLKETLEKTGVSRKEWNSLKKRELVEDKGSKTLISFSG